MVKSPVLGKDTGPDGVLFEEVLEEGEVRLLAPQQARPWPGLIIAFPSSKQADIEEETAKMRISSSNFGIFEDERT